MALVCGVGSGGGRCLTAAVPRAASVLRKSAPPVPTFLPQMFDIENIFAAEREGRETHLTIYHTKGGEGETNSRRCSTQLAALLSPT